MKKSFSSWLQIIAAVTIVLAVCGTVFRVNQALSGEPPCLQIKVFGQWEINSGLPVVYRIQTRHGESGKAISGVVANLRLLTSSGSVICQGKTTTDQSGSSAVKFTVPEQTSAGLHTLAIKAHYRGRDLCLNRQVKVERKSRILVTTDKPLYQPGQIIHIRLLGLSTATQKPMSESVASIEVEDPKGNIVFRQRGKTSKFGVFAADFQLAQQVNLGAYTVRALIGGTSSQREVTVKHYKLPSFAVKVDTTKGYYAPGETVQGKVSAQYIFGKPVAKGKIKISAKTMVEKMRTVAVLSGTTDADGVWQFSLPLGKYFVGHGITEGDASVTLEAEVTDSAGHREKKTIQLRVTKAPLRVNVFSEGKLIRHKENRLYIIASYADGTPAKVKISLEAANKQDLKLSQQSVATTNLGLAIVGFEPKQPAVALVVKAKDEGGLEFATRVNLGSRRQVDNLVVRTDRPIYLGGQSISLSILSTKPSGTIFVDVLKEGQVVYCASSTVNKGEAALNLDLPPELTGTLEVRAYRINNDGGVISARKVVQVMTAQGLNISAKLDKSSYGPAEKAKMSLQVTDKAGKGVLAALGCAAVDEAVFALHETRPGLERVFFEIEKELLQPRYQFASRIPFGEGQVFDGSIVRAEAAMAAELYYGLARGSGKRLESIYSEPYRVLMRKFNEDRYKSSAKLTAQLALIALFISLMLMAHVFIITLYATSQAPAKGVSAEVVSDFKYIVLEGLFICFGCLAMFIFLAVSAEPNRLGLIQSLLTILCSVIGVLGLLRTKRRLENNEVSAARNCLKNIFAQLPFAHVSLCIGAAALGHSTVFHRLQFGNHLRWYGSQPLEDELGLAFSLVLIAALVNLIMILRARHYAVSGARFVSVTCVVSLLLVGGFVSLVSIAALTSTGGSVQSLLGSVDGALKGAAYPTSAAPSTMSPRNGGHKAPTRVRRHFPETLFWQPEVITDEGGKAELTIPLADSITQWRFSASAVSLEGKLGALTKHIPVFQPFFVDIDAPLALTQNDEISIPVTVFNYLKTEQSVKLKVKEAKWFTLLDKPERVLIIGAGKVAGVRFRLKALKPGVHPLLVEAHGSDLGDAVERQIKVEPDGKEFLQTFSGRLEKSVAQEIHIPQRAIDGAISLYVKMYPGPFSQVLEGLEGLLRMPSGCFEQTSSTTYPNVLVLQYLRSTGKNKPKIEAKALKYIKLGYQRLLTFEVQGGGFEWFGKEPANNILTAYGVLEFADMCRVTDVDSAVLSRTKDWLYSDRKADGSFVATSDGYRDGAINDKSDDHLRTTAYITWALAEAFPNDWQLKKSLDYLAENLKACEDSYTLAMAANAFVMAKDNRARGLIDRLSKLAIKKGEHIYWQAKSPAGAFSSRGNTLTYETTAIAIHALIKSGQKLTKANKALAYLIANKDKNGTWGSTQATVHCLRALLASSTGTAIEDGATIKVLADGKEQSEVVFNKDNSDVLRLIDLKDSVKKGKTTVRLETSASVGAIAYQIVASHYLPWPKDIGPQPIKALTIDLSYDAKNIATNDLLKAKAKISYNRPGSSNMVIVDLGIPPGFALESSSIDKLVKKGTIARWSLAGNRVTLYFSTIRNGKPIEFTYLMRARNPVKAVTPPSWIYDYYEPELKDLAEPVSIEVTE